MNKWKLRWGLGIVASLALLLAVPTWAVAQPDEGAVKPGKIVFSKTPINAAKPENLVTSFKTGDYIYALVQTEKNWRDLLGKSDKKKGSPPN